MSLIILCTYLWIIFCYWNWFAFKGLRDLENFIDTVKRSHLPGWKVVNKASSPKCEPLSVPFLGAAEECGAGSSGAPQQWPLAPLRLLWCNTYKGLWAPHPAVSSPGRVGSSKGPFRCLLLKVHSCYICGRDGDLCRPMSKAKKTRS